MEAWEQPAGQPASCMPVLLLSSVALPLLIHAHAAATTLDFKAKQPKNEQQQIQQVATEFAAPTKVCVANVCCVFPLLGFFFYICSLFLLLFFCLYWKRRRKTLTRLKWRRFGYWNGIQRTRNYLLIMRESEKYKKYIRTKNKRRRKLNK